MHQLDQTTLATLKKNLTRGRAIRARLTQLMSEVVSLEREARDLRDRNEALKKFCEFRAQPFNFPK